ncbi:MAG: ABC transporter substrate-binding protein [Geminicoccaceae bacterium]|nr:ABC transporter substrate-binding protein [Geminicoccaceae bacterium]MCS7269006.1 ABC transporter substrate-binding protein [Geminicoccaceae bacterium]MCX7629667.1 ABC transporter substrate-binding protein [Geminicoccaceae bacterium]MDW8123455.1 ABC transporter substrate-binding protein [Geminicoccaceae bacterium]MDW8342145.1 ABC transporter substrate-binding protein [Geminicoccaceae bacterium]
MPAPPLPLAALAFALLAGSAAAQSLRFSFQSDVGTLDPHGLNETFTLGFLGNVYEGLTTRGPDLRIEPGLAERWELLEPTRWRFHLRRGVRFHDGSAFSAEDVVFSAERVRKPRSDVKSRLASVKEVIAVDDYTVDFVTEVPNPILDAEWDTWYIMDKDWAERNGASEPVDIKNPAGSFANFNANGTGPFRIVRREPDVRTIAVRHDGWWGKAPTNLREVVFQPIANDATRVAALLSGELDLVLSLPIQDVERVARTPGLGVLVGPELRTIFLGFDQSREELLYSSVKGKNPFKDRRVRLAVYQAIDTEAIVKKVMRGQAVPSAAMVAPGIRGFPADLERHPFDPAAARRLLAEAGYPEGFGVTLDCPNDRYVNDEQICQAIVGMLARIGIKVTLNAQPKSLFFAKVLAAGGYDTSFYLLGWTPGSLDSWNALYNLVTTRDGKGAGAFNLGGYSNPRIDALTRAVLTETDLVKRDAMIREAWRILHEDVGYVPLHQQALAWGVREGVELVQRADNQFLWRWVVKR